MSRRISQAGFTLVETLVVLGIVLVLSSLLVGAFEHAMDKGKMVQDLAAGKTLTLAYQAYAAENNGVLMVGYKKGAPPVSLPNGQQISGEPAARYAWRLAPYYEYRTDGIIYGADRNNARSDTAEAGMVGYGESLLTSYGINAYFVGGYDEGDNNTSFPAGDVATSVNQVQKASQLLVFATARHDGGKGNFVVTAPRRTPRAPGVPPLASTDWQPNNTNSASSTGNVDARYDGKALCAFLDGSVRSYSIQELNDDMRLWSKNAAAANNPNYSPTLAGGSTGGGGGR